MAERVTTDLLFETYKSKLKLIWLSGQKGKNRLIHTDETHQSRKSLIGHLNAIHPNQIQVLGRHEIKYLDSLGKNTHHDVVNQMFTHLPAAVIFSDGTDVEPMVLELSERTSTPLLTTTVDSQKLIRKLRYYLDEKLASSIVVHGVFMEVHGLGVLLIGEAGIGKSELALDLINRGHRLIADDAPEFSLSSPDTIRGTCPPVLSDFLEVRGLGIINIREMFGDSAIKPSKNLRLVVRLQCLSDEQMQKMNRLEGSYSTFSLLDAEVPEVLIPVTPGRSLAVLIEAATRQHIQLLSGYNAAKDFMSKQQRLINND